MPEQLGTEATTSAKTTHAITLKGLLVGAFAGAALGIAGMIAGVQYADDIKDIFNSADTTPPATAPATDRQTPPANDAAEDSAEDIETDKTETPTPAPQAPTAEELLERLLTALDNDDLQAVKDAIEQGADPHIIMATATTYITENADTKDEAWREQVKRRRTLFRVGVSSADTLAHIAFNPYFRDALPGLAALYAYNSRHTQAALETTAANNDLEGFKVLLDESIFGKRTANIAANDYAALHAAAENGSTYIMEYGLNWDAEHNGGMLINNNGYDILDTAMKNYDALMIDMLFKAQAHLMIPDYYLQSTFEKSAAQGFLSLYQAMIDDLGMDLTTEVFFNDGRFSHSYSPTLIAAAENNHIEIGRAAKPLALTVSWRGTPAIRATIAGYTDFVKMLRAGQSG